VFLQESDSTTSAYISMAVEWKGIYLAPGPAATKGFLGTYSGNKCHLLVKPVSSVRELGGRSLRARHQQADEMMAETSINHAFLADSGINVAEQHRRSAFSFRLAFSAWSLTLT
jgi:hypothetical protein